MRTSLLPGLLKTLRENKSLGSLKIFEVSDVVLVDAANDIGAKNTRNVAVAVHTTSGAFEVCHGVADRLMQLLEVRRLFLFCLLFVVCLFVCSLFLAWSCVFVVATRCALYHLPRGGAVFRLVCVHVVCASEGRVARIERPHWLTAPLSPSPRSRPLSRPPMPPTPSPLAHHQVAPTADYHAFDAARAVAEAKEGAPRYAVVPSTAPMFFPGFGASIELTFEGEEFSFIYRYILCESCSQFDSLPLTYLTIPSQTVQRRR